MESERTALTRETQEIQPFSYADSLPAERPGSAHEYLPEVYPQYPLIHEGAAGSSGTLAREGNGGIPAFRVGNGSVLGMATQEPKPTPNGHGPGLTDEHVAQLLAAERLKAEERGRGLGIETGIALGREEAARQLAGERERLHRQAMSLIESFSQSRDSYLHHLEREVVELALAIAARILRREAQMDPLLLTGAVRVALGQLAASTAARLRVPAQDQPMWEEALSLMPGLTLRPQVIGEPGMELGECRMETGLGSADLGLWPQLKEIERGFFDRVGQRSGPKSEPDRNEAEPGSAAPDAEAEFAGMDSRHDR